MHAPLPCITNIAARGRCNDAITCYNVTCTSSFTQCSVVMMKCHFGCRRTPKYKYDAYTETACTIEGKPSLYHQLQTIGGKLAVDVCQAGTAVGNGSVVLFGSRNLTFVVRLLLDFTLSLELVDHVTVLPSSIL